LPVQAYGTLTLRL